MDAPPCVFDLSALKRAERTYRNDLTKHPDNLEIRMRLAWCLFMQALYQSGQETVLQNIASAEGDDVYKASQILLDRNAQTLLKECLHQTFTVIQLSSRSEDREDGEKIQALVALSGGHEIVAQSRDRAAHVLHEMVREVMYSPFSEPEEA